ncbi:hypothetical protein Tco_1426752, partial [Tanacetum coccineum]
MSSSLPQILSPLLPVSPPPLPASPTYHLGYRAAMIRLRAESPSTSHPLPLPSPIVLPYTRAFMAIMRVVVPSTYILAPRSGILPSETPPSGTSPLLPIPLPTPSPPLLLPSTVCRAGVSEVTLPPRKRLCIALGLRFEVSESSSALTARPTGGFRADYGFVGTLDDEIRRDPERGLSQRMTDFVTTVRHDTDEIYGRLDDAQDDRSLISSQLNMLRRDRHAHAHTVRLIESEARLSRETWVQSMDASDTALFEETNTAHRGTDTDEDTVDTGMAMGQGNHPPSPNPISKPRPKPAPIPNGDFIGRSIRARCSPKPAPIPVGVVDALAARDADRSRNDEDSHDLGTGVRRQAPPAREYTYPDFMKCKPLYFKGTEGVVELTRW